MSVLSRYLLRQNLYLMSICLCLGIAVYLLSDLFERLDDFLEAGRGLKIMLVYFLVKIPLIISQILPAVFLVAMLVQLSAMRSNRELLALRAGGISYKAIISFFLVYSLFWSGGQLFISQYLGVKGLEYSKRIWAEDVRGKEYVTKTIHKLWLRENNDILHIDTVQPASGKGRNLSIYTLAQDRRSVVQFINAKTFEAKEGNWVLNDVTIIDPIRFTSEYKPTLKLSLGEAFKSFTLAESRNNPAQLPLWELGRAIHQLEVTGSNVEGLRTIWHGKLSYAFSITIMALLALAIITFEHNVYLNLTAGLVATFLFYGFFVLGSSAGEMGFLPPIAGAWLGNAVFILGATTRLFWRSIAKSTH
ncbi:LptF/LptG family permease [Desulfocurvibacter africanus]|uniref:LptF/LptG family permease n=1 Tax=Desulfocurvibacter africanus TaxID=873 RepID=UPI00048875EA|nr:LptF/LptG family permease [Desulfocurvibacter africanus]